MNTPTPNPATSQTPTFTSAVFLALSSGLTGVPIGEFQSSEDTLKAARLFHAAVCENVPSRTLDRLAAAFLSASTVTEGAAEVLIDAELAPIGRGIIHLWRTGVWHDPARPPSPSKNVCDHSYRQSSAWRIMQTLPMEDPLFDRNR